MESQLMLTSPHTHFPGRGTIVESIKSFSDASNHNRAQNSDKIFAAPPTSSTLGYGPESGRTQETG
jgi:hypothetical protein